MLVAGVTGAELLLRDSAKISVRHVVLRAGFGLKKGINVDPFGLE